MKRPRILFFDVNGTLLDTSAIQPSIASALHGRADLFRLWVTTMLHVSVIESAIDSFHEFSEVAATALRIVAAESGFELTSEAARAAIEPMRFLPEFPDVRPGLMALRAQGLTLAALTNSAQSACAAQLQHAASPTALIVSSRSAPSGSKSQTSPTIAGPWSRCTPRPTNV